MSHSHAKTFALTMVMCFLVVAVGAQPHAVSGLLDRLPEKSQQPATQKFNQTLVRGNNEFALNLYGRLRRQEGNIFFSPYSVSSALAMTYLGARGETAKQMASVLRLPADQGEATALFGALNKSLNGNGETRNYQLNVANALWGAKGAGFLDAFLKAAQEAYGAGLQELDFENDTEGSRRFINNWIAQKTQEKITDLMPPGSIKPRTRLVLTNAIYFKSAWAQPFDEGLTQPSDFTLGKGKKVTAPLMKNTGWFGYFEDSDLQVLELPYLRNELSMFILLPRKIDGLPALEQSLTEERLSVIESKVSPGRIAVSLPRFRITSSFGLIEPLRELGMELPFTEVADFSGMDEKKNLFISAVVHKAYVDVNEKGTEAAAATGVGMVPTSIPPPPKEFRADHPFLFFIRHQSSGSVLFMGRVQNPLQ